LIILPKERLDQVSQEACVCVKVKEGQCSPGDVGGVIVEHQITPASFRDLMKLGAVMPFPFGAGRIRGPAPAVSVSLASPAGPGRYSRWLE
jgi:hypothetical protein